MTHSNEISATAEAAYVTALVAAVDSVLAGKPATLVVSPECRARAGALWAKLPAGLQALLTLRVGQ